MILAAGVSAGSGGRDSQVLKRGMLDALGLSQNRAGMAAVADRPPLPMLAQRRREATQFAPKSCLVSVDPAAHAATCGNG